MKHEAARQIRRSAMVAALAVGIALTGTSCSATAAPQEAATVTASSGPPLALPPLGPVTRWAHLATEA